jgi:acyl carrier protein
MDTNSKVRAFIADTFFVEEFADGDSFLRSGIIDSTGMMELVAFVEETFGIKIADAELVPENLDSINNLCRFVERKRATSSAA